MFGHLKSFMFSFIQLELIYKHQALFWLKTAHMFRMDHGLHKFQDVGLRDLHKLQE